MDTLDRKIITLLETNGRASNARIARDVGVSEGTVRRRLKRLIQDNIINVVALPDPGKLGYNSEAIIGVQVDPDQVDAGRRKAVFAAAHPLGCSHYRHVRRIRMGHFANR